MPLTDAEQTRPTSQERASAHDENIDASISTAEQTLSVDLNGLTEREHFDVNSVPNIPTVV